MKVEGLKVIAENNHERKAIEQFGDDVNSFGGQRDGYILALKQLSEPDYSEKSVEAEEILREVFGISSNEFAPHFSVNGYTGNWLTIIEAMHKFRNQPVEGKTFDDIIKDAQSAMLKLYEDKRMTDAEFWPKREQELLKKLNEYESQFRIQEKRIRNLESTQIPTDADNEIELLRKQNAEYFNELIGLRMIKQNFNGTIENLETKIKELESK